MANLTDNFSPLQEDVFIIADPQANYGQYPYSPQKRHPELHDDCHGENSQYADFTLAYDMVRDLFALMGLDKSHFGTDRWNPLGDLIKPGMRVLVKPNWVREYNAGQSNDIACMYTHTAVIRPVLDYIFKALNGKGEVVIGDAPLQSSNFEKLLCENRMQELASIFQNKVNHFEVRDFRLTLWGQNGELKGDPSGYTLIDLGENSLHTPKDNLTNLYRVACYDPKEMNRHHALGRHEYLICNTALQADIIINLPKLKTHKKTGFTGSLKNFVGTVGHKEYLPHHTKGDPQRGGDEYQNASFLNHIQGELLDIHFSESAARLKPLRMITGFSISLIRRAMGRNNRQLVDGSWSGNDTLWRTILDLNRILTYYNYNDKQMMDVPQRKILTIVDGIIAGEGDGPLAPTPKHIGVLLGGMDRVAIDSAIAGLIGFDEQKIPMVSKCFCIDRWSLTRHKDPSTIKIRTKFEDRVTNLKISQLPHLTLIPAPGWMDCTINKNK